MRQQQSDTSSPIWSSGRFDGRASSAKLLFGHMYEDPSIELGAFPPGCRVFCIASAGCTAIALAKGGHSVTAVDINPTQISYLRARLSGEPPRQGSAEQLMAFGRKLFLVFGWRKSQLNRFLQFDNVDEQLQFWKNELDTLSWRVCIDTMLRPGLLARIYAPAFVQSLPANFGKVIRGRMERCWSVHPNVTNPYARALLLGTWPENESGLHVDLGPGSVTTEIGDAAQFLESCHTGSFDAFSLSNILDGISAPYRDRLISAVKRAATPDAIMVLRTFALPQNALEAEHAVRDRSMLWGGIIVTKTGSVN